MVRMPRTIARSAHNRAAVWNSVRCRGQQKRWRDPPRRGRNGFAHHGQVASAIADASAMTHMTQGDGPAMEAAMARACTCPPVEGLSWEMRHGASCVTPDGTHHRAVPARFPRPHPSRSRAAVMRR